MILEIGVIAATIALAVGAKDAERRRRRRALDTFETYARARSLFYVPPPKYPAGSSPRIEGKSNSAAFAVDLYRLGSEVRTRATAKTLRGVAPSIAIVQRGFFMRASAPVVAVSGDASFDRAYAVSGATAEDMSALREVVVPALVMLDGREGVSLVCSGDEVRLSWSGVETDPLVLDAARDTVVSIATMHRSATPYR